MKIDISPSKVNMSDGHWFNFCDNMQHGMEKEVTCRLFATTAKKYGRWDLTQKELDAEDSSGSFHFNGLDDADWFKLKGKKWTPTKKYFGQLISCGRLKNVKL